MAWYSNIFGSTAGQVIQGVDDVVGTVWGRRDEREHSAAQENMAVHNQFASEYQYRGRRYFFDSVIDGFNRSIRPGLTYLLTYVIFIWPYVELNSQGSVAPQQYFLALALTPDALWIIYGTIITFWFGSRALFKDRHMFNPENYVKKVQVYKQAKKLLDAEEIAIDSMESETANSIFKSFLHKTPRFD